VGIAVATDRRTQTVHRAPIALPHVGLLGQFDQRRNLFAHVPTVPLGESTQSIPNLIIDLDLGHTGEYTDESSAQYGLPHTFHCPDSGTMRNECRSVKPLSRVRSTVTCPLCRPLTLLTFTPTIS